MIWLLLFVVAAYAFVKWFDKLPRHMQWEAYRMSHRRWF
jgi:hypothetical protein